MGGRSPQVRPYRPPKGGRDHRRCPFCERGFALGDLITFEAESVMLHAACWMGSEELVVSPELVAKAKQLRHGRRSL